MSTLRGSGPVYFEIGCAVLLFVTLGRFLEARGKQQAAAALESLERLLPTEVRKLVDGQLQTVPLDSVAAGDRIEVHAGERIPVDGRIVRGTASLDSRVLTGESLPQFRESGDEVLGGTLDLDGDLLIEATASPRGGTWQRLLDCMRTARRMKGRHQQLADRVARWFMPAVAVIAVATFAWHTHSAGIEQGLSAAMAVVLVACPCALGLATPLAVWAGLGSAAQAQVLFRNGEALERLAGVRAAAFDKTGTLTDGRPLIAAAIYADSVPRDEIIRRAHAIAAKSRHDLAAALADFCRSRQIGAMPTCEVRTEPGRGLTATFSDRASPAALGSERLMRERGLAFPAPLQEAVESFAAAAMPLTCLGWDGGVRAVFGFNEQLRDTARAAVDECRQAGLAVVVLTGDHAARGAALAKQLDVPVQAELLPDDKVRVVGALRQTYGPTAMVGDGLNDAPALTAADVGLALGCGADVSRQSADVCLLGNDPARVAWSIGLARQTLRIIRQNLFWSFAYNTGGIALAAAGWLNPIWAAVMMTVGGLSVVGNSLRLAHFPQPRDAATTVLRPDASFAGSRDRSAPSEAAS
jgi:heavy metal translocating P-type ATPase